MAKWFTKKDKPHNCFTRCSFCYSWITEEKPGLLVKTADHYHWHCLLKLKDQIMDLERRLNRERNAI